MRILNWHLGRTIEVELSDEEKAMIRKDFDSLKVGEKIPNYKIRREEND